MTAEYTPDPIDETLLDAGGGPLLLDFGTNWCGWCRRAVALVDQAVAMHPGLRHLRIEDGPGRRLGRRFRVRQWPTLILLDDGRELARLVRPAHLNEIEQFLGGGGTAR
ncbi:MAG: thioredoxin family protein [Rhodocyclaceae bacterium]|nr:thioredoxin family protein [Rhodocyclaceae bacterium]